ncbi:GGDEF domain-containing protein [Actinoplanes sp. Pm04-4]|uniref:GGDEF domain-containing protein n=1 Tax=Paractinoplanes pyxinae TaxID=2997416 RepID=A0ABT4BB67_9ACTN|nr:GGDEF domain-containing protein [Actinoplanes pyxinae]MCY1143759.1 GGDEF domain-containing protein [Actinoplanes pyxinae]
MPNRAAFNQAAERAVRRYATTGARTAALLVDLDGFKAVNDTYGHQPGDQLLREIAGRLTREAGDATVSRLGGDEFVILTERSASEAARLADRLVQAVAVPVVIEGHVVQVGASIGVAVVDDVRTGPAELLRQADAAMYEAKNAGRSAWRLNRRLTV